MPGSLRLCAGCVAVPGHQPPSRLDHDGRPVGSKTDKPPLLGITADGNNKTCKFPRTGSVLEKAAKRQFFDFFPQGRQAVRRGGEEPGTSWVGARCLSLWFAGVGAKYAFPHDCIKRFSRMSPFIAQALNVATYPPRLCAASTTARRGAGGGGRRWRARLRGALRAHERQERRDGPARHLWRGVHVRHSCVQLVRHHDDR